MEDSVEEIEPKFVPEDADDFRPEKTAFNEQGINDEYQKSRSLFVNDMREKPSYGVNFQGDHFRFAGVKAYIAGNFELLKFNFV